MRDFKDIKTELDKDLDNEDITNDTLKKRYADIASKHFKSDEVSAEDKEKLTVLIEDLDTILEDRHDFKNEIEEKLLKLQEDIIKGYRVFNTSRGDLVIKFPGIIDDEEIELLCSKLYNKLLQDGDMLTESEIIEKLEKRNIWTKVNEKHLEEALDLWRDLTLNLNREKLKPKKKRSMKRINQIKKEADTAEKHYDELNSLKTKHVVNSIEMRVEELRLRSKLLRCIHTKKDGTNMPDTPYWPTIDALRKDSKSFIYEIFNLAQHYWSGVDPSFLDEPPSINIEGGIKTEKVS